MILSPYFKEVLMDHIFGTASPVLDDVYVGLTVTIDYGMYYVNRYAVHSDYLSIEEESDSEYRRSPTSFTREETKIKQRENCFFSLLDDTRNGAEYTWFIADAEEVGQGNVLLLGYANPEGDASDEHGPASQYCVIERGEDWGVMLYGLEITAVERVYDDVSRGFLTSYALLSGVAHFLCRQEFPSPNTHIALLYEMPDGVITSADDLFEISGTGYQRIKVNPAGGVSPAWNFAVSGEISNSGEIVWDVNSSDWSEIVGYAVVTDEMSGEVLAVAKNFTSSIPQEGRRIKFLSGSLVFGI